MSIQLQPKTKQFQQGGSLDDELIALVQAAQSGDQKATQQLQQISQAAQKGDQQAIQIMQRLQQLMQSAQKAENGAKLNYIARLRGKCPSGYTMSYYKAGGVVCQKCIKAAQGTKSEPVSPGEQAINDFKKKRKEKCGGKMKK